MSDAAPVIRLDKIVRAYATPDAPPLEVSQMKKLEKIWAIVV